MCVSFITFKLSHVISDIIIKFKQKKEKRLDITISLKLLKLSNKVIKIKK